MVSGWDKHPPEYHPTISPKGRLGFLIGAIGVGLVVFGLWWVFG